MSMSLPVTDPVLIFTLVMLIILVMPWLFMRLRLPGVIGLIVAGIVFGPNATQLLAQDATFNLLGTVGLLYIMFIAGLEIDLNQFRKQRHRSAGFGLLSFALPQMFGTAIGFYLFNFGWPSSILLGSLLASHTLVAYPIASRLGIGKHSAVTTAVGGTILTDTLALLVLAIVAASTQGALDATFWTRLVVSLLIYVVAIFWGLPRVGRKFFRSPDNGPVSEFAFVLAAVFGCAYLAEVAGVEPIIGAFLAGLALNRLVPENSSLMARVQFVGDGLFIPFFLIWVGMHVDVRVFVAGPSAWVVAIAMVMTVTFTKWLAAFLTQKAFGYSSDEGRVIFGLSVPQAAATLAAVLVGYDLGLFNDEVLNGAILMMLVTCVLGPWLVDRHGRRMAIQQAHEPAQGMEIPSRIAVPLANPQAAESLMDVAFVIRDKETHEPVYPLTVTADGENVNSQVAAAERMLGYAVIHAAAASVPVIPVTRVDASVPHGLHRAFTELRVSTAVIGWDGKFAGMNRVFGGILDRLITDSRQQLLVCRIINPINTIERILLLIPSFAEREMGFDEAIQTVKKMAQQLGAKLVILTGEATVRRLEKRVGKIKPDASVTFTPIRSINDGFTVMGQSPTEDDLCVLLSARQGRISWQPVLDRLPRRFVRHFPDISFITLLPMEIALDPSMTIGAVRTPETPWRMLSEDRVQLQVKADSFEQVIQQVIEPHFADQPTAMRHVVASLQQSLRDFPVEVTAGVVLLHCHSDYVERPTLFLATLAEPLSLPRISSRIHVVFLLVSPQNLPPKEHLDNLASVARLLHDPETLKLIHSARTTDTMQAVLSKL